MIDNLPAQDSTEDTQPQLDGQGRAYGTGRRKTASARVWIKRGSGRFVVNGREVNAYFARPVLRILVQQPFAVLDIRGGFDVFCSVKGSGISGQAGAVRHGLSRALVAYNPLWRSALRKAGYITRDSRKVERKKYGQPGARKRFQFSKR